MNLIAQYLQYLLFTPPWAESPAVGIPAYLVFRPTVFRDAEIGRSKALIMAEAALWPRCQEPKAGISGEKASLVRVGRIADSFRKARLYKASLRISPSTARRYAMKRAATASSMT